MKAQTYTILLTMEAAQPLSSMAVKDAILKAFDTDEALLTVSVSFGNHANMSPTVLRIHNDIIEEYRP